jgi:hypothetical protein
MAAKGKGKRVVLTTHNLCDEGRVDPDIQPRHTPTCPRIYLGIHASERVYDSFSNKI